LLAGAGAERSLPRPRDAFRASIIGACEAAFAAAVAGVGACLQAEGVERTRGAGVISRQRFEGGCFNTRIRFLHSQHVLEPKEASSRAA
jgi:hypothetical protein